MAGEEMPDFIREAQAEDDFAKILRELRSSKEQGRNQATRIRTLERQLAEAEAMAQAAITLENRVRDPDPIAPGHSTRVREACAVGVMSDWHVGAEVTKESVQGLNEHNPQIARERGRSFFQGLDWMIRRERCGGDPELGYKVDSLLLAGLGDDIEGHIHDELVEANRLSPAEEVWLAYEIQSIGIEFLAQNSGLKRIDVWRENGNHDRPTRKVRYATNPRNSYGYLLSRMLMRHFEGHPIVRVHAPLSDVSYAQVFDQTIRMMHGHQIGYQGGVGGITIPLKKWLMRQEKGRRADLTLLGHFHTYTNGPGFLVNTVAVIAPRARCAGSRRP